MFLFLVVCPVLLSAAAQTLTIDTQLGTSTEDCFERISLGQRLPTSAIYRNTTELSARACERHCTADRQCQSFDYGVGAKGNATCNLSNIKENDLKSADLLERHPDYDTYVRRFDCEQSPPKPLFDDGPTIPNRPVIRPGIFEETPEKNPERPLHGEQRPYKERPNKDTKPYQDLSTYETNNWPARPFINNVPYGRPIKNRYDYYDYKPKPIGFDNNRYRPEYDRPQTSQYVYKPGYDGYRPSYGNIIDNERPDDYGSQKPEFDGSVGYGTHMPQDAPLRPRPTYNRPSKYPSQTFNNHTYRPTKPDPNDILYFQNHNNYYTNRPVKPESLRPDPHYPVRPEDDINAIYGPQKPSMPYKKPNYYGLNDFDSEYYQKPSFENYVRPNKKPYPIHTQKPDQIYNHDYGNRPDPIDSQRPSYPPGYGSSGPSGPPIEKPYVQNRPHDRPGNSQYRPTERPSSHNRPSSYYDLEYNRPSSNYQNPNYNSYNVMLDHNVRPQASKPQYNDYYSGGYGGQSSALYGSHGTSSSGSNINYGHESQSHSSGYGSNHLSSGYGSSAGIYNYGDQHDNQNTYGGSQSQSGNHGNQQTPTQSSHNQNENQNYHSSSHTNQHSQSSYGSHNSQSSGLGSQHSQGSSYGSQNSQSGYDSQINKPTVTQISQSVSYGQTNTPSGSYGNQPASSPKPNSVKPVYEYELDRPVGDKPSYVQRPGGEVVSSKPVAVSGVPFDRPGYGGQQESKPNYNACYRRVLAGRRALRSNVRRVLACERLEECQRECAEERRFHCESFNYKLDPSFRRKGLCELMTKPIEYFDLQRDFVEDRDYDFYELDRNSLQPECNLNWHGPAYAHSGYLGGATQDWRPGYDQNDVGYRRNQDQGRYYERNHYRNYGEKEYRRRWDDQFVPYQIGVGRSNDEDWAQYGGSYGSNHIDKNDHMNSLNYWGLDQEGYQKPESFYGVRPHGSSNDFNYYNLGNQRYDGNPKDSYSYGYGGSKKWNNSGYVGNTGLVYGESNYYRPNHGHTEHHPHREEHYGSSSGYDCSSRRRAGMSLGTGVIRKSLLAQTVLDCEAACFRETGFKCVSYSYRYSKSQGAENCFLSETPYRGLDLASDSGSDVYSMADRKHCASSGEPWIQSECFLHVRSGKAVSGSAIKAALSVGGLGACEAECIRARGFFCRGFSFRFDPPTIGDEVENCLLTSHPPSTLHQLKPGPGHELYARGNYGRGCEPDLTEDPEPGDKECYLQYDNAARLMDAAARGRARARDEATCARACTDAPFRCLSFSYSSNSPHEDNCLLSEIRLFDLKLGVDYEHSANDWLFAFDLFNKECWRKIVPGHGYDDRPGVHPQEIPRPILPPASPPLGPSGPPDYPIAPGPHGYPAPPSGPGRPAYPSGPGLYVPPSGPGYRPGHQVPEVPPSGSGFRPSGYLPESPTGSGFRPSGYLPESPTGSGFRPSGYLPESPRPVSGPSGAGFKPGYLPGPPAPPAALPAYPGSPGHGPGYLPTGGGNKGTDDFGDQYPVSWRHYTVSGFPCRQGSACAQNVVAGHWSCEPEGGEVGSWDYCCAPNHRCGYSEGFHKPWCHVGPSKDQWRPCSEKYYPYHQHNVPHPSQGHRDTSQGHREERPRPQGYRPEGRPDHNRPWVDPDRADHSPIYHGPPVDRPAHRPSSPDSYLPYEEEPHREFIASPYLPEGDRQYWDDLYKNGPTAYYDSQGNPLPGYVRIPTAERPRINYHHNDGPPHGEEHWAPLAIEEEEFLDPPVPGGFGAARYWPVAYLHKGPPPNTTYFNYQDNHHTTSSTERYNVRENPPNQRPAPDFNRRKTTELPILNNNDIDLQKNRHRDEKTRNLTTAAEDELVFQDKNLTEITTLKNVVDPKDTKGKVIGTNTSEVSEVVTKSNDKDRSKEAIDDKLDDFSSASIEVLNLNDEKNQKGEKSSEIKTLEAEERQIEEIGRLLSTRRGGKFVLEKRSQSNLESQNIKIARGFEEPNLDQFNFGSRFVPVSSSKIERRGIVQKVPKDVVDAMRASATKTRQSDQSLEVSETSYAKPAPNQNADIRQAIVNGQIFYDATLKEHDKTIRDSESNERTQKFIKVPEIIAEPKAEVSTTPESYGQRTTKARNINPLRKGRRYYRRKYNPEEVRKRLLDREKSKEVKY